MRFNVPFILASGSPRRKKLLEIMRISFTVRISDINEIHPADEPPASIVRHLALEKARAVASDFPNALVLGADTIVVHHGSIMEKPLNPADAVQMLSKLQNDSNTVYSGIALIHQNTGRAATAIESTEVHFGKMNAHEIQAYVDSGSPLDKAGGYGLQDDFGAAFISGINGDYYNVIGLPVHRLYRLICDEFTDLIEATF